MSVAINNLINFSRALPEPMDKLTSKKIKVSSKYGSGTEATLSATVIKAVHAVIDCMNGTSEGAVGVIDHRMVAEYKSSSGPDAYHLVVYDSVTGIIVASGFDKNTEMIETYRRNNEYLKTLNRPVAEIMEEKYSNDEMINECEGTLHELNGVMAELKVYAAILDNSVYSDNRVHICLAHECSPNADDHEIEN